MGVSINGGTPTWMIFYGKIQCFNGWFGGYSYFRNPKMDLRLPWISTSQVAVAIGTVREAVANGMAAQVQGPCVDLLHLRLATWQQVQGVVWGRWFQQQECRDIYIYICIYIYIYLFIIYLLLLFFTIAITTIVYYYYYIYMMIIIIITIIITIIIIISSSSIVIVTISLLLLFLLLLLLLV